jgi:cell wall-associated NlpC family hydrolase
VPRDSPASTPPRITARRLAGLAVVLSFVPAAALTTPASPASASPIPASSTSLTPIPASAASVSHTPAASQLSSGATLLPGTSITSPGGAYQLTMQPTGHLAETGPSGQLWATGTSSPGTYLVNQPGGDLVLITAAGTPVWSSATDGEGPATLVIQADGNVVDYRGSTAIWSTGTGVPTSPSAPTGNPPPPGNPAPPGNPPPPGTPAPTPAAAAAIAFARKQIGKPYKYGGAGPAAYDCSGLAEASYAAAGVSIPRTSQDQYKQGQKVAASARQPGDLVFYNNSTAPTHVAMYLGNNQIIESLKPGTNVRIDSVAYPGAPVGYRRYG